MLNLPNKLIINVNNCDYELEYRYTKSKAAFTYGFNICSAYINGKKVGMYKGGIYDMRGFAIKNWLQPRIHPDQRLDCGLGLERMLDEIGIKYL